MAGRRNRICKAAAEQRQPMELKMHRGGQGLEVWLQRGLGPIAGDLVFEAGGLNSVLKVKGYH